MSLLIGGMTFMATVSFGEPARIYNAGIWIILVVFAPSIVYLAYFWMLFQKCNSQHRQFCRRTQSLTAPATPHTSATSPLPYFGIIPFICTTSLPGIDTVILPKRAPLELKLWDEWSETRISTGTRACDAECQSGNTISEDLDSGCVTDDTVHPPLDTEMDISPVDDSHLQVGHWAMLALIPGRRRDIAKNTIVVGVTHYKCRTKEQDEKLLIVLITPRDGVSPRKITYVVTDRSPNHTQRRLLSPNFPLSSDVPSNWIFIPGTGAPSLERYHRRLSQTYDTLCTMTLLMPLSLAQLAVLLKTVNLHSVPFTYQCYWYPYTIWEVLRREFGGFVTENKLQDKRGQYKGFNVRHENSVEGITDIYIRAWRTLCEEEIFKYR
jgi:hypothetical protein